jgi:hypothetical protein
MQVEGLQRPPHRLRTQNSTSPVEVNTARRNSAVSCIRVKSNGRALWLRARGVRHRNSTKSRSPEQTDGSTSYLNLLETRRGAWFAKHYNASTADKHGLPVLLLQLSIIRKVPSMQTRHPLEADVTKQNDAVLPLGTVNVISLRCIDALFIGCRFLGVQWRIKSRGHICYLRGVVEQSA